MAKSFQKIRKLLNFRNANNSSENYSNFAGKFEWKGNFRKKFSKIWVYLARLSSFLEILENAVPFATRSCRNFKPDVLVDWKAPKVYCSNATVFNFSVFLLFIVNANMIVYFLTLCNTDDNCAEPIKCPFLKMLYTHIENIKKKCGVHSRRKP